jgi:hypothetical protein
MKTLLFISMIFLSVLGYSQEIARFTVFAGDADRLDCPVGIGLDQFNYNEDGGPLSVFEISTGGEIPVSCQLETGHTTRLWIILSGETPRGTSRSFILRKDDQHKKGVPLKLQKRHGQLRISSLESPILDYQFETLYPPEGINPLFKRSGFIHPLWSPDGQILSRIQPPDHYHHYGIWGPWTKTHIRGREVDFWNLLKGQGTVRFSGFTSEVEGPVYSGFKALQEHIDFGATGPDQVAIMEVLDVRAWNPGETDVWLVDYTINLNTPLDSGIMLDAYRYGGGIGFRATENWHKDNSTVLTSEKKDRISADGTKARWCLVEGESVSETGRSGILFMGHPSNREFPEPMRVWPVNANGGRGDVYFEFCPIRHNDWMLEKGRDYTLKYRLLIFDGAVSYEEAELYWQGFAHPPKVEILSTDKP